jgi:hypothetical protein
LIDAAGSAEKNLALTNDCLVLLRAMARVVRRRAAADIMVEGKKCGAFRSVGGGVAWAWAAVGKGSENGAF